MKSKLLKFICFFLLFFSFSISTKALSTSYKDIVKYIVNIEEIETNVDKINTTKESNPNHIFRNKYPSILLLSTLLCLCLKV